LSNRKLNITSKASSSIGVTGLVLVIDMFWQDPKSAPSCKIDRLDKNRRDAAVYKQSTDFN